jgi:APA family basic amino acid/polyamine antiporter
VSKSQRLSLNSAVAIGFASMIGAGVFVVFREAVSLTGSFLWLAMLLAALVAALNAASVYQLSSVIDRPGGVYSYSRVYLNDTWSFVAGFSFVFGKIGSIAAIAAVLGEYLSPLPKTLTATVAIGLLTLVNIFGINRTALVAKILTVMTVLYFSVAAVVGTFHGIVITGLSNGLCAGITNCPRLPTPMTANPSGLLSAAAILFFAFAGYARVATLGDEVEDPKRNIPKAIRRSLIWVLVIYCGVSLALVATFGGDLATLPSPFKSLYRTFAPALVSDVVTLIVVTAACLGSMLALLAGVSRTAATMAEDRELPQVFERRNRFNAPWLAETVIAFGAILLLQIGNLSWMIGFSSLSVLLYYAIGHMSALRQPKAERVVPRIFAWVGLALCALLLVAVPGPALWVSALILAAAVLIRRWTRSR